MRLAILGANGFIGTRLVEQACLAWGLRPVPIVRRASAAASCCRFPVEVRVADAMSIEQLASAFRSCDGVVHAAAGDELFVTQSVVQVYQAARQARLKFLIYLSSMAVHGWQPAPGTQESSRLVPRHPIPYNNWKIRAEQNLARVSADGEVRVIILRPGIVYGPRSQWSMQFIEALSAQRAAVVQQGAGVCNAIYVDNLNHAILLAAQHTGQHGEAFLVNDARALSWREFYEPLCRALGRRWDEVHDVTPPPQSPTLRERYESWRDARLTQRILRGVPVRLRYALSQAADAWFENPLGQRSSSAAFPVPTAPSAPSISRELAILQQCNYAFPCDKARQLLGYQPIVEYDEACERTRGWLKFVGYPVR